MGEAACQDTLSLVAGSLEPLDPPCMDPAHLGPQRDRVPYFKPDRLIHTAFPSKTAKDKEAVCSLTECSKVCGRSESPDDKS